ncbi:MAG: hypothetical protein GX372_02975 [Ignavibacteria bacterium]|jgi:N-glycosylase/DNA lyase|nr:hypothetical protein [Ignavibacteria bacterium]
MNLPDYLSDTYKNYYGEIQDRLKEFEKITPENSFYEFCFCLMTPQSSANNAWQVQRKLEEKDFFNKKFDPKYLLADSKHYIRFHNKKSERLLKAIDFFPELYKLLISNLTVKEKRLQLKQSFSGLGMKESSHFLRNIGYKNLAIIDRHVLKHLEKCNVIENTTPPNSINQYINIENSFLVFCDKIDIPIDVMDLLFFAHDTGKVLK